MGHPIADAAKHEDDAQTDDRNDQSSAVLRAGNGNDRRPAGLANVRWTQTATPRAHRVQRPPRPVARPQRPPAEQRQAERRVEKRRQPAADQHRGRGVERHGARQNCRPQQHQEDHATKARQRTNRPREGRHPLPSGERPRTQHSAASEHDVSRCASTLHTILGDGVLGVDCAVGNDGHAPRSSDAPTRRKQRDTRTPLRLQSRDHLELDVTQRLGPHERAGSQPDRAASRTQRRVQRRALEQQLMAAVRAVFRGLLGKRHAHTLRNGGAAIDEIGAEVFDDVVGRNVACVEEQERLRANRCQHHPHTVLVGGVSRGVDRAELGGQGSDRGPTAEVDNHRVLSPANGPDGEQGRADLMLGLLVDSHDHIDGHGYRYHRACRVGAAARHRPQRPRQAAGAEETDNFDGERRKRQPEMRAAHRENGSPHEVTQRCQQADYG